MVEKLENLADWMACYLLLSINYDITVRYISAFWLNQSSDKSSFPNDHSKDVSSITIQPDGVVNVVFIERLASSRAWRALF